MVEPTMDAAGAVDSAPRARPRRRWALIAVAAVLVLGLAYELIRFDHGIAGQLPALAMGGLLAVGIVVVLIDPGPSRTGRTVAGVALAAALVFTIAQLRTSTDPLVGDWTAGSDGMPAAAVAITHSPAGYTVRTRSATRLPGGTCDLPPGTVITTFTGTSAADHGQQLVSSPGSCVSGWETATVGLDASGTNLHAKVPSGHDLVLVKGS